MAERKKRGRALSRFNQTASFVDNYFNYFNIFEKIKKINLLLQRNIAQNFIKFIKP